MKNFMNRVFFALLIISLIVGCATMQSYWENASLENTIESYKDFLKHYPEGEFSEEARSRLEELAFHQSEEINSIYGYEKFLKDYPYGKNSDKARLRLEELRFIKAKATNTIWSYEEFYKHTNNSKLALEAFKCLNNLRSQIKDLEKAVTKVLPEGAKVEITTVSQYPRKPEFAIKAHLLEGHSADESNPYVRGDYGTHEKLTRLVRYRCAKILKSISEEMKLPDGDDITISARHGVRQSYYTGVQGTDVSMTIYEISISIKTMMERELSNMSEESIMKLWEVNKNIIPSLQFQVGWY